jgi:hypothetical protein
MQAYASGVSDPVGLARLPAELAAAVDASASALAACAAQLDAVLDRADDERLAAMTLHRAECGRTTAELLAAVVASRRTGPDRSRLAELARTADRTADAIASVAWAWSRHPIPELADVLRALRDATRAAARSAASLEDEGGRLAWDTRCREREAEARFLARSARGELIAAQDDVRLAAAAHDVLTYVSLWLAAVARLRAAVLRFSLE